MKRISKRLLGAMLAIIMVVSMVPNSIFKASATNASTQSTYSTFDIIEYGSYPQTKVTSTSLISALNAQTLQDDSTVIYDGSKYKRIYFTRYYDYWGGTTTDPSYTHQDDNGYYINTVYWFKFEPIRWRVLSNTNGELFVLADKILDRRAYNQIRTNVTWETCTMRSWLNNDFYFNAFNSNERAKIKARTVVNANNPFTGTNGGNNTNDKLFLLSHADTINPAYGFSSSIETNDNVRQAQGTDYSESQNLQVGGVGLQYGNSVWWLRSPNYGQDSAGTVYYDGGVWGNFVADSHVGVRPAFKINLSSVISTSKKAIYYLPGYMGSKLYDTSGNLCWGDIGFMGGDIVKNFPFFSQSNFQLNSDGNDTSFSHLKVDRVKDNTPVNGNYEYGPVFFDGVDGAAAIMQTLKSQFLKTNGGDYDTVKFFSYDWRKSLKVAADELQADINSGGYDQVVFVCHSTGGLLAAEYIAASTANQQRVEKVITLGSPLLGTYESLTPLETGQSDFAKKLGPGAFISGITTWTAETFRTAPCNYQLLPSNEYVSQYPIGVTNLLATSYRSVNNINGFYDLLNRSAANLNSNMINGSGESHKKYRETYVKGNIMNIFKKVQAYHIAGIGTETEISVKYTGSVFGGNRVNFDGYNYTPAGDGTVTQTSACGVYKSKDGKLVFPKNYGRAHGVKHEDLVKNANVLNAVVNYIKTGAAPSDINASKTASQTVTTTNDLITTGAGMSDTLIYRICGNVDISVLDSAGTQVAFLSKENSSGFSDSGLLYNYINADMDEVDLLLPNAGFKVVVTSSAVALATVDFTAVLSTLQDDGGTESTVIFSSPLQVDEKLTLDAVSGIVKDNIADVRLLLTKADLSTETVAPTGTKTDYADSLSIDETVTIEKDNLLTINAVVSPTGTALSWTSSDESVVTIDENGNATAVGYGNARITAMTNDGSKFATCYVEVPCLAESISYSPGNLAMTTEENTFITPVFSPSYATNTALTYESDNETVAIVDADGMVSAKEPGTAVITATTDNGKKAINTVTVESNRITANQSSTVLLDETNGFIMNITNESDTVAEMMDQVENTNIRFLDKDGNAIPENSSIGTGVRMQLLDREGTIIDELTVIIYGDVNGDGNIDSIDAGNMVDYENYLIIWDSLTDAALYKSSDLNGDGNIDSIDAGITVDAENYMAIVNQTTGEIAYQSRIIFNSNGGTNVEPLIGYTGDPVVAPLYPVKEGYKFVGWDPALPSTFPEGGLTVTAQWSATSTITFNSYGGSAIEPVTGCFGDPVFAPSDPIKAGFTFAGWEPALPATYPENNLEVTAQWSLYAVGDIIEYGIYPQTKVTDESLIAELNAQILSSENTVSFEGEKYQRVYFTEYTPFISSGPTTAEESYQDDNGYFINTVYWFKFEPLQWRVLSITNGELFVMADKILESREYNNQVQTEVIWETCAMRSWLNNDFYNTAFNAAEQTGIKTSIVVNANNPLNETSGSNNTYDKLFLLSYGEAMDPAYGFSSDSSADTAREAKATDYSRSQGLYVDADSSYYGNGSWWLRSPGSSSYCAGIVWIDGLVYDYDYVNYTCVGVRPAFKINLSTATSTIAFNSAGGSAVESITRHVGFPVVAPSNPTKLGYTFVGWLPELPSTFPESGLTVTAQWSALPVSTITFNSNGGSAVEPITGYEGDPITAPLDPIKEGLTFAGWNPALPPTFPEEGFEVTAQWTLYAVGDIIEYGTYPQTKVTDESLITELNMQTLSSENTVSFEGEKYQRVYFTEYTPYWITGPTTAEESYQDDNGYFINTVYWFRFEPILWRVLSITNGEFLVMSDKIIESREYYQEQTEVTWETCAMRSWLNNDFYNTAFNSAEQSGIKTSILVNANNPWDETTGGNNTYDKLFLLSYSEAMDPAYGFSSDSSPDTAREAKATDFSRSQGLYIDVTSSYYENGSWWLRSPGGGLYYAGLVDRNGSVQSDGSNVYFTFIGARPVFKINLSSLTG